ncbi:MAG: serine hydrolase [Candidatus Neomarinimicrobiota bacterium]
MAGRSVTLQTTGITIATVLLFLAPGVSQDSALKERLVERITGFHGDAGLYFKNLKTGETISIGAQDTFPTASLIKIPIAVHVFDLLEKRNIAYTDTWIYRDSLVYGGSGYLQFFKDSTSITVKDLVHLMLTVSDNVAAIWLTKTLGGGDAVNESMDSLGLSVTRMNSFSTGREVQKEKYGWGMTTAEEMGLLMENIFLKRMLTRESCEEIYRILSHPFWDSYAPTQVPSNLNVASKTGALNDYRSEVACVNTPEIDYVICIITDNNQDQRWVKINEADQFIIDLNRVIFDHFHPEYSKEFRSIRDSLQFKY